MNKILSFISIGCIAALTMTSCMNEHDDPSTDKFIQPSLRVNATIGEVKDKYCSSSTSNFFAQIKEDLVIEGTIVANDISGNLYQTVLLRDINKRLGTDECIQLAIKNTCLYPYFPLGQRIKVNLKGLYAGCYSYVPKIGQPYYTSKGNLRLGPMLFHLCQTHIEYVGEVDLNAPELVPIDLTTTEGEAWLRSKDSKKYTNVPMLATVRGKIAEVQGNAKDTPKLGELSYEYEPLPKIFAPEELYDAGYAVDRTIQLGSGSSVTLRTSTQNPISFMQIPEDTHSYTGILTYYSQDWQIQLRTAEDISED